MNANIIYQGNSLEVLKTFPDESINCCVTSPPYFNCRDYQTAKWIDGDINCDHICVEGGRNVDKNRKQLTNVGTCNIQFKKTCKKCGAIREDNQIGIEETPKEYVQNLLQVFSEVKRILKKDGTLWLNLGDSYSSGGRGESEEHNSFLGEGQGKAQSLGPKSTVGYKPKQLLGIPWMVAFELQRNDWWLRQDIVWNKPNSMPESVKDRCTKSHEYIFLLSKSKTYYFDSDAIKEPTVTNDKHIRDRDNTKLNNVPGRSRMGGLITNDYEMRNKRSVWTVSTKPLKEAHFATFNEELITPCILAGCPEGGIVLDPFMGSGTTAVASRNLKRNYIGIELNPSYIEIANKRINTVEEDIKWNNQSCSLEDLFK